MQVFAKKKKAKTKNKNCNKRAEIYLLIFDEINEPVSPLCQLICVHDRAGNYVVNWHDN